MLGLAGHFTGWLRAPKCVCQENKRTRWKLYCFLWPSILFARSESLRPTYIKEKENQTAPFDGKNVKELWACFKIRTVCPPAMSYLYWSHMQNKLLLLKPPKCVIWMASIGGFMSSISSPKPGSGLQVGVLKCRASVTASWASFLIRRPVNSSGEFLLHSTHFHGMSIGYCRRGLSVLRQSGNQQSVANLKSSQARVANSLIKAQYCSLGMILRDSWLHLWALSPALWIILPVLSFFILPFL